MTIGSSGSLNEKPAAITRLLAEYVCEHPSGGWGADVEQEAQRSFLNWLGCAIGASQHEVLSRALDAVNVLSPSPQASVLGRSEKVDIASAALLNGISSHTFDYDDTHATTLIHPSGPIISAVLALAEHHRLSGRVVTDAIVLGIDVACRVGLGMYPEHYDRGWHITGTAGPIGAAAACARLLNLDAPQTTMALALAASQPVGIREQFGTMTKPFHPGAAARAGLMSAIFASKGFTASSSALEAKRGFFRTISSEQHWGKITAELGSRFEIMSNTYKPFACGVVMHPSIDGCVQLRTHGVVVEDLERIELRVHPLVIELTGKETPKTGLEGKFSVFHGCAVGYLYGRAGESEFSEQIVNLPEVVHLRSKIQTIASEEMGETSADVTLVTKDGRRLNAFVERASGSIGKPLSDVQLDTKFEGQVLPILGQAKCGQLLDLSRRLGDIQDVSELCRIAT